MAEQVGQIYFDITADTSKLIDQRRTVERETDKMAASFNAITQAVKLYAAALALVKSAQMADDTRLLAARVQVAAGSLEQASAAMAELQRISTRTQTSIEASATVFTRLNSSIKQMGGTQSDTLRITELLGMAVKVSGASAAESASAMTQFGQALGSGKLAGDELRSLLENAPYLMQQLANGLGVPIGALKGLGEQGKLTADVVVTALGKAATTIEADFRRMPQTLAGAFAVATDAAARANEAFDAMTGGSAALTGVTKGLGDVLDMLASQFKGATTEADKLSRGDTIKTWASATTYALSFVADAADFVVRGFRQTGLAIYETAMAAKAAAGGELKEAGERMVDLKNKLLDIGAAAYAGAKMRQQLAALATTPEADPMDRRARGGGSASTLKAVPGSGDKKPGGSFDPLAYLAGLRAKVADAYGEIDAIEEEELRKNAQRLRARQLTVAEAAEAETLIRQKAAQQRQDIGFKEATDNLLRIEREGEQAKAMRQKQAEDAKRIAKDAADYVARLNQVANPLDALRQEYEAKLAMVQRYEELMALAGVSATEQAQIAKTSITAEYERQRQAMAEQIYASQGEGHALLLDSINALSSTATGAIMGLLNGTTTVSEAMRSLGQVILNEAVSSLVQVGVQQLKNAMIGQTVEAAEKTRRASNGAAYAAAVSAQVVGMTALAAQNAFAATAAIPVTGPSLAPAAAASAASVAGALGAPAVATAPLAGARQYGGPTTAGNLYRVNETGRPEMFTASNGNQFLLGTTDGTVTAADKLGGAQPWRVIINNAPPGTTASVNNESRIVEVAVARAEANFVGQISENAGPMFRALTSATNVRGGQI